MLEKAGVSTGPQKKPSQTTDRKDMEVQTEPNTAYPVISMSEENAEIVHSTIRPATISHQTEVHPELRSRVTSQPKTSNNVIAGNTNVVGHDEHSHFVNPLPSPLPSGYKPNLAPVDNTTASASLA